MSWDSSRSFKSHQGTPTNKYTDSSRNLFDYRLEFQQSNCKNSCSRLDGGDGISLKKSLNFFRPEESQGRLRSPGASWAEQKPALEAWTKESFGQASGRGPEPQPSPRGRSPQLLAAVRLRELQNLPDRMQLLKQPTGASQDKPTATRDGSSSPNHTKKLSHRINPAKSPRLLRPTHRTAASHFSFLTRTDLGLASQDSPPPGPE